MLFFSFLGEKRERTIYDSDDFYSSDEAVDDDYESSKKESRSSMTILVRHGQFEVKYALFQDFEDFYLVPDPRLRSRGGFQQV